jgi:hypothetical protein
VPRPQLNLRLDADLHRRLAAAALADGTNVSDLCRAWIIQGLDARAGGSSAPSTGGLAERLALIEERLAALERTGVDSAGIRRSRGVAVPRTDAPVVPTDDRPDGALTSPELGQQLGITPTGLNAFASRRGIGAMHRSGWRVAGKLAVRSGGPDRWLWLPPEAV